MIKNLINSRKYVLFHTAIFLLLIGFCFGNIQPAYAEEIENTAQVTFQDGEGGKTVTRASNKTTTEAPITKGPTEYGVDLVLKVNSVEISNLGKAYVPATVKNIGKPDDTYNLALADLPTGVVYTVYLDRNCNGTIDPEEKLVSKKPIRIASTLAGFSIKDLKITTTPLLKADETTCIIYELEDKVGLPQNTNVKVKATAISNGDITVSDTEFFNLTVPTPIKPTDPSPTPSATETPAPNKPIEAKAALKKTVYPSGKVKAGDVLTYYIEFTNTNSFTIKDVEVIDRLPTGLTLIDDPSALPVASNDGKISYSADGVNWVDSISLSTTIFRATWSALPAGITANVYFKAKVPDSLLSGEIINIASAKFKTDNEKEQIITIPQIKSNEAINIVKNDYSLIGKVINKDTGLPEENAKVEVFDLDDKKLGEDITGKSGKFKIPLDKPGDYKVIYTDSKGNIITQKQASVTKPGENPAPIEISGKVMNSQTKETINNATLTLIDKDGKVISTITTNEKGRYRFEADASGKPLQPGSYTVRVNSADGRVSYARANVSAIAGDVLLNVDLLIDPFGFVYDFYGGQNVRIKNAEVTLLSRCDDPKSIVVLQDLEKGVPQKNPIITNEEGTYQYFLTQEQLKNKTYCLITKAEGYQQRILLVRAFPSQTDPGKFALEILEEDGKSRKINNIETIPYEIGMKPLKVFDIKKTANKNSLEIGDIVTYTVEVSSKLKFNLIKGLLVDELPFGFKYVPNTLYVNGKKIPDSTAKDPTKLEIVLGDMRTDEKFVVIYQTRTGIRTPEGPSINKATISAKTPSGVDVPPESATATVFVKKGVFSKNGTIIGKVFVDTNNDGMQDERDVTTENIVLYTSNGLRIITDTKGKFSIPDMQMGQISLKIDKTSLPKDTYTPGEAAKIASEARAKLEKMTTSEIDLLNTKKVHAVIENRLLTITNSSDSTIVIELKDNSTIEIEGKVKKVASNKIANLPSNVKVISTKDLLLDKGMNTLKVKRLSPNGKAQKNKELLVYMVEDIVIPDGVRWIGEDDIAKIIYVPESGLVKANFRLTKVNTKLPEIPKVALKDINMKAVYVYPDKFSIKQMPYITYPDIKSHWSREVVEYESGLEIIHGYPDGLFKPARNITRAETTKLTLVALKSFDIKLGTTLGYIMLDSAKVTAKILDSKNNAVKVFFEDETKQGGVNRIFWDGKNSNGKIVPNGKYTFEVKTIDKEDDETILSTQIEVIPAMPNYRPTGKTTFPDVPEWHWATSFIKAGVEEKLITGYNDGKFRPDSTIPRYEMAVVGVHALGLNLAEAKEALPFADANEVPAWARKYVYLAYTKGLLPQFPDKKFYPNRPISRAEIAQFVLELINRQKITANIKGSTTEDVNKLMIEGKEVNIINNMFDSPVNKELSEDVVIGLPENDLRVIDDSAFPRKNIKRPNVNF